ARYPAASTAASTAASSTGCGPVTANRPDWALTWTSVTSGSCETASRTEVSHPPQLIPWTTNSLVCIPVLLFRHACLDTLYPYSVYFNEWFPWHPAIPGWPQGGLTV